MVEYLFNEEKLRSVYSDCDLENTTFPVVGASLLLRPLSSNDFKKGFVNVLGELTVIGQVDEELFINRFNSMKSCQDSYFIIVIEDIEKNIIVGSGTLVVEKKFIHGCSSRGRIEDVVVTSDYRGKDLGKILVSTLLKLAQNLKCYKVSLECKDKLVPFYESFGLQKEAGNSNYMQKRFY